MTIINLLKSLEYLFWSTTLFHKLNDAFQINLLERKFQVWGVPLQFGGHHILHGRASLVAQLGRNLPAMQEAWVQSLGWEDPLEEGMVTHSSILAWEIPGTGEPGGMQSMGLQKSQTQRSD